MPFYVYIPVEEFHARGRSRGGWKSVNGVVSATNSPSGNTSWMKRQRIRVSAAYYWKERKKIVKHTMNWDVKNTRGRVHSNF